VDVPPGPRPTFALPAGGDVDLVLREPWTAEPLTRLVEDDLELLRAWEPWAAEEPTVAGTAAYGRSQLVAWVDGLAVPTVVRERGVVVGAVGARLDPAAGTADLGWWLASSAQGRGVATRAVSALADHLVAAHGVRRLQARVAVGNTRSLALAARLGLRPEGVLLGALAVGGRRLDVEVHGLDAAAWRRRP